jgi:hypothetical protein
MEFFYDGQIRRYVTQFMRIFIGFKYQSGDETQTAVPVMYGDMTRQVAAIIRENSENKMPSVPRIACYITGLELDRTRLADATYVSKINIQERDYVRPEETDYREGVREYKGRQGNAYTVERLMPTPFVLKMKADIWTSNTDQKLQLLEQILVLFNPSLEIQTTDNYIDWTSLSVVDLESSNFSSRSIPQGAESDIDICSLEFKMPIYITPPAKVKRMGVVRDIVMNVFNASGEVGSLNSIVYNGLADIILHNTPGRYGVLLLSSNIPGESDRYNVSVLSPTEAVTELGLDAPVKRGERIDWNIVLRQYSGRHIDGISLIHFIQPNGGEITGTFSINAVDPTYLDVRIDMDTILTSNSELSVTAIINPLTFNPVKHWGGNSNIPVGTRYLLVDDIGGGVDETVVAASKTTLIETTARYGSVYDEEFSPTDSQNQPVADTVLPRFEVYVNDTLVNATKVPSNDPESNLKLLLQTAVVLGDRIRYKIYYNFDGADAWAEYLPGQPLLAKNKVSELIATANDIIQWNGSKWSVIFDSSNPDLYLGDLVIVNATTGIQYRWDGEQWIRSFEGEYRSGFWRFTLN